MFVHFTYNSSLGVNDVKGGPYRDRPSSLSHLDFSLCILFVNPHAHPDARLALRSPEGAKEGNRNDKKAPPAQSRKG